MSKNRYPILVLAGLVCMAGAALAETEATTSTDVVDARVTADESSFRTNVQDEHWRHDGVGEHERNMVRRDNDLEDLDDSDIHVRTREVDQRQVAGVSTEVPAQTEQTEVKQTESTDRADRCSPPFADLERPQGQCKALGEEAAIENDKLLLVRGERKGDELLLNLPEGTKRHTLSLRSGTGMDISHAELDRIANWLSDTQLSIKIADLESHGTLDLNDLWVWGTGPESGSLLQRVNMDAGVVASSDTEDTRVQ